MRIKALLFFGLFFFISSGNLWAQREGEFEPTTSTSMGTKPDRNPNKPKRIRYLYRSTPKNTLSGNACFMEVTRKMGFEYVVMPYGEPYSTPWIDRALNNIWVGLVLCLRNGPWWPLVVAHKRKECRLKMGDYVG